MDSLQTEPEYVLEGSENYAGVIDRLTLPEAETSVWWPRDQTFLVVEVGALPMDYVSKFGRLYGWSTTLAPGSNGEPRHESDTDAVRWGIVALREKVLGIPILQSGFAYSEAPSKRKLDAFPKTVLFLSGPEHDLSPEKRAEVVDRLRLPGDTWKLQDSDIKPMYPGIL